MDPFDWLDAIFGGGGGGGYSSAGGGPRLDQGFAPVAGWMVNQAFAGAGPVGQYFGMAFGSPGSGIPRVQWGTEGSYVDHGSYLDFTHDYGDGSNPYVPPGASAPEAPAAAPAEARTLEVLDRDGSGPYAPSGPVAEVTVLGSPPPSWPPKTWSEVFQQTQSSTTYSGPENPITWTDPPPARPPRPKRPSAPASRLVDPAHPTPEPSRPEREATSAVPTFDAPSAPAPGGNPWASDAAVPDDLRTWGSWQRPEAQPVLRPERGTSGEIGAVPRVPTERGFFDRGGAGLAAGAVSVGVGVAVLMWWNPVGWVAGVGVALALAGGVAATAVSAVELSSSYAGVTTAEQDAQTNRAVAATLGYTSVGGALGAVAGTVLAENPQAGFEQGAMWGGFGEGAAGLATSLPGALRAAPGLGRAALPWAKSLMLEPMWFLMAGRGAGGGSLRATARVFAAQNRLASGVRQVEYLGTTPLVEANAAWARYQVFATGSREEGVFRLTYAGGRQRIVMADAAPALRTRVPYRLGPSSQTILEAKYGDLGQMWNLEREAHIMQQVNNYLDITRVTGGRVGYLVSTERGAARLAQRFGRDFPAEVESGQLWVDWRSW